MILQTTGKETVIETLANLIKNRKWDMLIIIALLASLFVAVPMAISFTINKALTTKLEPLSMDVKCLYDMEIDQIKGAAVAGFKKFSEYNTTELLFPAMDKSAQNTESIRRALLYPESRILLVQLSPQKTKLFELYFDGEVS